MNTMTPLSYYHEKVTSVVISHDIEQEKVMVYFEHIQEALIQEYQKRQRFFSWLRAPRAVQGLYLYGGVGIGKTFMMDCFYHTLPFETKLRMHFHQFMHLIHEKLTAHQGEKDPLLVIAKKFAASAIVICFDELFVSDITDAMLLGRLFNALFKQGVSLVATSNVAPDDLYKYGLQRSQFLPAIALLKKRLEVLYLPTRTDYRLRHLKEAGVFYTPLNTESALNMEKSFVALTDNKTYQTDPIFIHDRPIRVVKRTEEVVWFEFKDLCTVPRSQHDYLALTEQYKTIFISNIPLISAKEKDTICLFINLIDVLYDARTRIVISAAMPVDQLYNRGYMIMEYTRTHSRLLEMQSEDYFLQDKN